MLKLKHFLVIAALLPLGSLSAKTLLDSRLEDFYRDLETRNISLRHQVKSLMGDTVTEDGRQKLKRFLSTTAMNLRDMPMNYEARTSVGQHLSQIGQAMEDTARYVAPRPKLLVSSGEGEVAENIQIRIPKAQKTAPKAEPVVAPSVVAEVKQERPKLEDIILAEKPETTTNDIISNSASAPSKPLIAEDSIWFEVAGWSAVLLAFLAAGFFALRKIVRMRKEVQATSERARIQNKRYNFFNNNLKMLVDAPTPFVVITERDEVCWTNHAANTAFAWNMGKKISNIVKNFENVGNDTYEMQWNDNTWIVQMKPISMKSARSFRLLTLVNTQSTQTAGKNYVINEDFAYQGSELRSLLEKALERKAYLFQVSGVTLNFAEFPSSQIAPAKSMSAVIENTLHAIHLMLKDHQGIKDVTIRGINRGERIGLSFTIRDFEIAQDTLKQVSVYPGKRAENAATAFRRNEMILAPAKGRVLISHHKDAQGAVNSEIEIWMNRVGAAKARSALDAPPPLPN